MGGTCRAIFRNGTPCSWDVKITQIGAKFFYQDANGNIIREWVTYKGTSLRCGGEDYVESDDPNGCVQQLAVGITVYIPGEGEKSFVNSYPGDKKHCALQCVFTLGPKRGAQELAGSDLESALNQLAPLDEERPSLDFTGGQAGSDANK